MLKKKTYRVFCMFNGQHRLVPYLTGITDKKELIYAMESELFIVLVYKGKI